MSSCVLTNNLPISAHKRQISNAQDSGICLSPMDDDILDLDNCLLDDDESWLLASPAVTQRSKNEDILSWIQHGSGDLDAKARNHLANKLEIAVKRYQQKYSPSPAVTKPAAGKDRFTPNRPAIGTAATAKKELFRTPAPVQQQPFVNGSSDVPEFLPPSFAELDEEEDFVDAQEWIIPSNKKGIPSSNTANVQRHETYLVRTDPSPKLGQAFKAKDMKQLHDLASELSLDARPPSIDAASSGASSLKESDSDHSGLAAVAGIGKDISPKPRFDDIQLLASLQEEDLRQYLQTLRMGSLRRRKSSERDAGASGSSSITRHESLMVPVAQQQSPRFNAGPQGIGSLQQPSGISRAVTSRINTGLRKPTQTVIPSAAPVSVARNSTGSSGGTIPPMYTNSFQAKQQRDKNPSLQKSLPNLANKLGERSAAATSPPGVESKSEKGSVNDLPSSLGSVGSKSSIPRPKTPTSQAGRSGIPIAINRVSGIPRQKQNFNGRATNFNSAAKPASSGPQQWNEGCF